VLERAEAEFGMHGAVFPRGTLRVAALQADGVAAVMAVNSGFKSRSLGQCTALINFSELEIYW
jgi:hypothetical protein